MEWLRDLWAATAEARASAMALLQDAWERAGALIERTLPFLKDVWDSTAKARSKLAELGAGFGDWIASFHLDLSRDSAIVISALFLALAVPSIVSAWVDRRVPQIGLMMLVVGGLLTFWTVNTYPQDYVWQDVPDAFIQVIASIVN